jgi:hypothetical protein
MTPTELEGQAADGAPPEDTVKEDTRWTIVPPDAPAELQVNRIRDLLDELRPIGGLAGHVGEIDLLLDRLHGTRAA